MPEDVPAHSCTRMLEGWRQRLGLTARQPFSCFLAGTAIGFSGPQHGFDTRFNRRGALRDKGMSSPIAKVYATLIDREYQRDLFDNVEGLQRKGTGYIGRCPFHGDDRPTMVIYGDRPEYFCFACSSRGDWIRYLMETQGMTFDDSLSTLTHVSGIECPGYTEDSWREELAKTLTLETSMGSFIAGLWSPSGEGVLHYLYTRGYATGEVRGMALGFFPGHDDSLNDLLLADSKAPGLVIPYRDISGRLMGLVHKDTRVEGRDSYRPLTALKGLEDVPFLFYRSRGQHDVIVVDGFFDALLLDQIRLKPVMGMGSAGFSKAMFRTAAAFGCGHFIFALGNGDRQICDTIAVLHLVRELGLAASVLPVPAPYGDIDEFIRMTCLDRYRALLRKTIPGDKWLKENS